MIDPLRRVVLAVSTFRTDASVIALLEKLFSGGKSPFAAVIVVDSLGDGALQAEIEAKRWPVSYHDSDRNLGSAGNLGKRIELAAATDADWCYAINHDGDLDLDVVRKLVESGSVGSKIGAAYPRIHYPNRGGTVGGPRHELVAQGTFVDAESPNGIVDVAWGTSNGALYNLAPTREGICIWSDLWMGWEDFAYGWQLSAGGWRQIRCQDATIADPYEYRQVRFLGKSFYISDKAPWYVYYAIRNLFIIRRRSSAAAVTVSELARRIAVEAGLGLLFRRDKLKRLRLAARGSWDGLVGRTGKGPVP